MPAVQIKDPSKHAKAVSLLIKMGGTFRTRPPNVLVVGLGQFQALVSAGLASLNHRQRKARTRGKKAKA